MMLGLSDDAQRRCYFAKKPAQRLSSIWTRPVCSSTRLFLHLNLKPVLYFVLVVCITTIPMPPAAAGGMDPSGDVVGFQVSQEKYLFHSVR